MTNRVREIWPIFPLLMALACSPAAPPPSGPGPGNTDGGARTDAAPGDASNQAPGAANTVACQRLKLGPFSPVTGQPTTTYANPGPPIENTGQSYRITLPPPPKFGHVTFKVPTTGEYVIFTSRSVPITVFSWEGVAIPAKAVDSSVPECTEVKGRETFDLRTDTAAHVIRLGGDSAQAVDLVISRP